MKPNHTTIEIPKETHKRLKLYAVTYGFQISILGDRVLRDFLDKEEAKGKMPQINIERKVSNIGKDSID